MALNCDVLVFGADIGIMNASLTANAEALRHEVGTAEGLICDCEKVLRFTSQMRISSNSMPAGNALPISVSSVDFGTITGYAICTSREVSYSRDQFTQDNSTYDLITSPNPCAGMTSDTGADPGSCPAGWSTLGHLVNGTYTHTIELLRNEVRSGSGDPGDPLLRINLLKHLRHRYSMNATFERNPITTGSVVIVDGSASTWQDLAGCRATMTLESADSQRSDSVTGIVTVAEMTMQKEGWATWSVTVESQACGETNPPW
jgi:hypothetical protein